MNVEAAIAEGIDHLAVDVHAEDVQAMGGEGAGGGQADIAKPNNTDPVKLHATLLSILTKASEGMTV